MTALVTGVAGFIGSTLAERLVSSGQKVIGIDSFSDYYDRETKELNLARLSTAGEFTLLEADLNTVDLSALLADVEVIYHQAGQPGVRKSWGADFVRYVEANISATQRLLESSRNSAPKLTRFVYASSSSVYGDAENYPTRESDCPQPRSPYGVTKLAAEHLVSLYAANFGLPAVSLRYFTVYGPRQRPDMAFNRFISGALSGSRLTVHGDGKQIREFTYVDDIVEANVRAGVRHWPQDSYQSIRWHLDIRQRGVGPAGADSRRAPERRSW
ncbi:MAG: NAD-dependent epimerase/dehydratase family protein [Mycobacterium sp.]|nr:NAD-dependent epimerase/dehydratase family protein [Mycobacterium sp.]